MNKIGVGTVESDVEATLRLSAGTASAVIVGGALLSVGSLRVAGREWLCRDAEIPPNYRVHGQRAGITLLHPWANRLGADRFPLGGQTVDVSAAGDRLSRDGNGLPIHGLLAPRPWRLARVGDAVAVASLTWLEEPAFPFAHQVCVRFTLSAGRPGVDGAPGSGHPDGGDDPSRDADARDADAPGAALTVETRVSALSDAEVPVAIGWHPYFRRCPTAAVDLPALVRLAADAHGLLTGVTTTAAAEQIALPGASLDFGVGGLDPGAEMRLAQDDSTVTVRLDAGYAFGQVFAPEDAAVVSLEPMVAPTDALREPGAVPVATPGHPVRTGFSVTVRAGDGTQRAAARR
ncbi:aldose 1-epimerase [Conexibacter sp. DBS9H8]|uniref:aldose 1-epimerase n=1 Tax=Conexibacter sp. DBS9H8 TaxID=2937801 RepID=UPI00200DB1A4|nr:aldose 1-epimerase [Conexibacter sp. DBS9H8]